MILGLLLKLVTDALGVYVHEIYLRCFVFRDGFDQGFRTAPHVLQYRAYQCHTLIVQYPNVSQNEWYEGFSTQVDYSPTGLRSLDPVIVFHRVLNGNQRRMKLYITI